jgi:hypothetical protein
VHVADERWQKVLCQIDKVEVDTAQTMFDVRGSRMLQAMCADSVVTAVSLVESMGQNYSYQPTSAIVSAHKYLCSDLLP